MHRKEEYLEELIQNIQTLETRVVAVKNEDALSFSFFRDAFQKAQDVMKLLHELEMQQIEDMKKQMEKLVLFLSETDSQSKDTAKGDVLDNPAIIIMEGDPEKSSDNNNQHVLENKIPIDEEYLTQGNSVRSTHNIYADGIVLPVYTNPSKERENEIKIETKTEEVSPKSYVATERNNNSPSVNDVLHALPSKIEVKRNLSLNDRFFFQRELFNNKRDEMNEVMDAINKLETIEEVESYLRNTTSWNFEDEKVKGFLELLGKTQE